MAACCALSEQAKFERAPKASGVSMALRADVNKPVNTVGRCEHAGPLMAYKMVWPQRQNLRSRMVRQKRRQRRKWKWRNR